MYTIYYRVRKNPEKLKVVKEFSDISDARTYYFWIMDVVHKFQKARYFIKYISS